jgi:hypothetical protein
MTSFGTKGKDSVFIISFFCNFAKSLSNLAHEIKTFHHWAFIAQGMLDPGYF